MSAANDNPTIQAEVFVQTSAAVGNALRIAKAAQELVSKAPKPAPAEEIEKAASLLVDHGFLPEAQRAQALVMLGDPTTAMKALQSVIMKSAEAARLDPRLATGRSIPPGPGNRTTGVLKQASEPESEADRIYREKVAAYRNGRV